MTIGSIGSGVGLALTTVREHKMRSFLTVLGVIIGTGAVIGVGSIIAGLDGAITNILKSFGPNTIVVLRGSAMGGFTLEEQKRKMLTREDALAIEERCPSVEHVSPYLFSNFDQIHKARYKGNDNYQTRYRRHRRRLRCWRHCHAARPVLHRYREPAPYAGGRARRRPRQIVFPGPWTLWANGSRWMGTRSK